MPKNKSCADNGLTKEFSKIFCDKLSIQFIVSLRKSFLKGVLSNFQNQDKYRYNSYSIAQTQTLKKTLLFPISSKQSAYFDGHFISKSGRLIFDLLEIRDTLKLNNLLATIDIQKHFSLLMIQFYSLHYSYMALVINLLNG